MAWPTEVQDLANNVNDVRERIEGACQAANRSIDDITLIAVSKTKPVAAVRSMAGLGVSDFGENYLVEAVDKIQSTQDLDLVWHFIGRIQSNKTNTIAHLFDWVHTVDRLKIAKRLNDQCPPGKTLNILVQVNISSDPAKGGLEPGEVLGFIQGLAQMSNLRIRGLMTILATQADARVSYQSMAQLFTDVKQSLSPVLASTWDTLSMGMTGDLEHAVAAGATQVRIGTALFGAREKK